MKVWLINDYGTHPNHGQFTRNYNFGKELKKLGHEPVAFSGSHPHNTKIQLIDGDKNFQIYQENPFPWVLIKTLNYEGSKKVRVLSMFKFYQNMKVAARYFEKPDAIIGSSAHPLAAMLAIRLGKKLGCKGIVEIRDLWPEELIDLNVLKRNSILAKLMYRFEYWLYKNADAIIFTMEGGKQYIIDRNWFGAGKIDLKKVFYINNGVSLQDYKQNLEDNKFFDQDLEDRSIFKIVYTGSIRKANGMDKILDIATKLSREKICFLIWGTGDYVEPLQKQIQEKHITNVKYKGFVEKKFIPFILSKSDLNILNYQNADLFKYGCSNNKLFEYLASGKPILSTVKMNYSILTKFGCGIEANTVDESVEQILNIYRMSNNEKRKLIENTAIAANEFDFKNLTKKLVNVIEEV